MIRAEHDRPPRADGLDGCRRQTCAPAQIRVKTTDHPIVDSVRVLLRLVGGRKITTSYPGGAAWF